MPQQRWPSNYGFLNSGLSASHHHCFEFEKDVMDQNIDAGVAR